MARCPGSSPGCQAEDGVGQVVEPVADFLAHHVADRRHAEAAEDAQGGPQEAGHAAPPCGRRRPGTGGRYRSLSSASWMRAALAAAPVIV
jgi:hypothetical protein